MPDIKINRTNYFATCCLLSMALICSMQGCAKEQEAPLPNAGDKIINSLGMELAYIPAGEFSMGSPVDEDGRNDDEMVHIVMISRPFYIGVTEVNQAQWTKIMQTNSSNFKGDDLPVEKISWKDALKFCEKLSEIEGKTYYLPNEAQWEYACRAGTLGPFAGTGNIEDVAWYKANSEKKTHPCGVKASNAWSLYDMHGNVAEWCHDRYAADYPSEPVTDPAGPETGNYCITRGGSWDFKPFGCRSAARMSRPPAYKLANTGFRVAMEIK